MYLGAEFKGGPLIRQWRLRWGLVFKITPQPLHHRQRATVAIVQEFGWPQAVWTGVEKRN